MNILIHIVILLEMFLPDNFNRFEVILTVQHAIVYPNVNVPAPFILSDVFRPIAPSLKCIREEEKIVSNQYLKKINAHKISFISSPVFKLCKIYFTENILFETDTSPPTSHPV